MDAQSENLVLEAEAAYNGVVRDPARYADRIPILAARARAAGNTEALVIALRAQAWARHAVLDNAAAKQLLDQAARLAHRGGLSQREMTRHRPGRNAFAMARRSFGSKLKSSANTTLNSEVSSLKSQVSTRCAGFSSRCT